MALPTTTYDTATVLNPSSALTDFTLMVDLQRMTSDWWAAVDTTKARRGRAFKDDGVTELACDWIDFDSVARTGWLRVKWSGTLATSGTQILRVYPPNTANSVQISSSTYGSDNAYDADWLVYIPDARSVDRTANGNDGTAGVDVSSAVGKVGEATSFPGISGTGNVIVGDIYDPPDVSVSLWVKPDALYSGNRYLFSKNHLEMYMSNQSSFWTATTFTGITHTLDTWQHRVGTFDDATRTRNVYHNGTNEGSTSSLAALIPNNDDLRIGSDENGGKEYLGLINEFQVHQTARPSAWVSHEYDQTNDQSAFWGTWNFSGEASATTTSRSRDRSRTR